MGADGTEVGWATASTAVKERHSQHQHQLVEPRQRGQRHLITTSPRIMTFPRTLPTFSSRSKKPGSLHRNWDASVFDEGRRVLPAASTAGGFGVVAPGACTCLHPHPAGCTMPAPANRGTEGPVHRSARRTSGVGHQAWGAVAVKERLAAVCVVQHGSWRQAQDFHDASQLLRLVLSCTCPGGETFPKT